MITQYIEKSVRVDSAQWGDLGDVADISNWLTQKYGPETEGLIEEFGSSGVSSTPGPVGFEVDLEAEGGPKLFIKQSEDHFWVNPTDWIIMTYGMNDVDVAPMTDEVFQFTYKLV